MPASSDLLDQARWLASLGFRVIAIDETTGHITITAPEVRQ